MAQFESFKYELEEIEKTNPQTEDEWRNVVLNLVNAYQEGISLGAIKEQEREKIRQDTCRYYSKVKETQAYHNLYAALETAIGSWLPNKIVSKQSPSE